MIGLCISERLMMMMVMMMMVTITDNAVVVVVIMLINVHMMCDDLYLANEEGT